MIKPNTPSTTATVFSSRRTTVLRRDVSPAGDFPSAEYSDGTISGESHPPQDGATIGGFIDAEASYLPDADYIRRCRDRLIDVTARQDAINWILKRQIEWGYHLVAVACLSLAAKMEEIEVPLFMDLQLVDPTFVFEAKTIQRMELCVMDRLQWRLRSITPFDYLHYFISKLPCSLDPKPESMTRLFSYASNIILNTTLVIEFLGFAPSIVAAAAVLCLAGECQSQPFFHDRVNKEMVRSCHQLMEEYVVDTCPHAGYNCPGAVTEPPSSPVGVLDAVSSCGICETRSEPQPLISEAEPPNKPAQSPDANEE